MVGKREEIKKSDNITGRDSLTQPNESKLNLVWKKSSVEKRCGNYYVLIVCPTT